MKKRFVVIALTAISNFSYVQNGNLSILGNIGYQADYKRFALGVQGRYNFANNLQLAP